MKSLIKNFIIKIFSVKIKLDKIIDRFYGLAHLDTIKNKGVNCFFEGDGIIYNPEKITIGENAFIGRNFFLRAGGHISIGSFSHISRNVTIHTVNHNSMGDFLPYDRNDICKDVVIGQYVWIGMNVQILPGVKIGDGAIIGMGTIVSKNVEAGAIVVGNGQRVIGTRDASHTESLIKNKKFLRI